jgi:hypothetical protein
MMVFEDLLVFFVQTKAQLAKELLRKDSILD